MSMPLYLIVLFLLVVGAGYKLYAVIAYFSDTDSDPWLYIIIGFIAVLVLILISWQ